MFINLSKLLIVLLIPIAIIGGAVRVLTTDAFLALEYGRKGFPADRYGFTAQQRFDLASVDVHYVRGHLAADLLSHAALDGRPLYNPREVLHMADVRSVFAVLFTVWDLVLVTLLIFAVTLCWIGQQKTLAAALRAGGLLTASMVLTAAITALAAWQTWFELFHRVFFVSGSWLFSYSDTLIRLFPVQFWSDATLVVCALSVVGGLLAASGGSLWDYQLRTRFQLPPR